MSALVRDRDQRYPTAAIFARALSPFGSVGVLGSLVNVQREVGSLSSISAVRMAPPPPSTRGVPPVHAAHAVNQWTKEQSRKRQERSVMLGVIAALFIAASAAIVLYYFVPIRRNDARPIPVRTAPR
jgi:hypothetical protein